MVNRTRIETVALGTLSVNAELGRWRAGNTASWRAGNWRHSDWDVARSTLAFAWVTCACSAAAYTP